MGAGCVRDGGQHQSHLNRLNTAIATRTWLGGPRCWRGDGRESGDVPEARPEVVHAQLKLELVPRTLTVVIAQWQQMGLQYRLVAAFHVNALRPLEISRLRYRQSIPTSSNKAANEAAFKFSPLWTS